MHLIPSYHHRRYNMTNGLPENFSERWGAMEEKVGHMKQKLDKVEPADIDNLKRDMTLMKRIGGTIVSAIGVGAVGIIIGWRKFTNGG